MPGIPIAFDAKAAIIAAVLVFSWGIPLPAAAQEIKPVPAHGVIMPLDRPNPANVTVPDMAFKPTRRDIGDYDIHYYFHKAGVSYETAFAELDQCRLYSLETRLFALPPKFVPVSGEIVSDRHSGHISPSPSFVAQYGFVGLIVADIIVGQAEEDNARAVTNRCMAYKGYSRYGTSGAIWDKISAGSDTDKLARMALIASGPQPAAEAIDP